MDKKNKKLDKLHKEEKELTNLTMIGIILTIILIIILSLGLTNGIWKKDFLLGKSSLKGSVRLYVTDCLKNNIIAGKEIYDNDISSLKKYIKKNIMSCTDGFSYLKKEGFKINEGDISLSINILDQGLNVDMKYPITIKKDNKKIIVDDFNFIMQPTLNIFSDNGKIIEGSQFISDNNLAKLEFSDDTHIVDESGNLIENANFIILYDNFVEQGQKVVLGPLLYNKFDNVMLDKDAKLTIKIPVKELDRYNPEDVVLGTYNKKDGLWYIYDNTSMDEDLTYYIFSANINKI